MRSYLLLILIASVVLLFSASILPASWQWISFDWSVVLLSYWVLFKQRAQLLWVVVLGLLLDTLYGSVLGAHVVALLGPVALTAFFAFQRRYDTFLVHALWMAGQIALYEILLFCVTGFVGDVVITRQYFLAPLAALILLPFGHYLLSLRFVTHKGAPN